MLPDAGKVIWVSYCKLYEEMTWDIKDYSEQIKRPCLLFWQVVHNMKYNLQSYEDFLSVKACVLTFSEPGKQQKVSKK